MTLKEDILGWLGYYPTIADYMTHYNALSWLDDDSYQRTQIESILRDLDDIKDKLRDARADSMASNVGNIQLNYVRHIKHLHLDGMRLTGQLSQIVQIPILRPHFSNFNRPTSYIG